MRDGMAEIAVLGVRAQMARRTVADDRIVNRHTGANHRIPSKTRVKSPEKPAFRAVRLESALTGSIVC
jgi:hypothetical protein